MREVTRQDSDAALAPRDFHIVRTVHSFRQVTGPQLKRLVFTTASRTPLDRALKRLVDEKWLVRVERRIVGGSKGGSGQYVYSIGRRGFYTFGTGQFRPARTVSYHSLAIVDAFLTAKEMEAAGQLQLLGYSTEPDCHVEIASHYLKPDLFLDVARTGKGATKLWLEIDMGTEGQRQIKDKFQRYWSAYNVADTDEWPVFPLVLFVAVDAERERELKWLIGQGPTEAQQLFRVTTYEDLSRTLIEL